ncbi:MAG: peptidylprolyl isomerase [Bacteroidetes bacterium SW_4_67_19]|nr:MAG: peptidylprolyl isomerase [Bacteroidetes bacterium SW_4_67_19]
MRSRSAVRRLVFFALLLGIVAFASPARAQDAPVASGERVVDEIVAVVEDNVILRSEVAREAQALLRRRRQQQGPAPPAAQVWDQVLQQRINQQVLSARAAEDTTLTVSDAQVQQYLDRRISRLAQRAGGRQQLEQTYGKSITQIKADFRDRVRQQLLAQQLRQRRLQEVRVTPSEVREWFNDVPQDSLPTVPATVQLSHVVRYPEATEGARQQAREVITTIRDSAVASVPIEEMARRYSDDSGSASQGGRIQTSLDELVPSFAAVVSRAPIGEISKVFETPFGFHIVRVNERSGNTVDFNQVLVEIDKSASSGKEARSFLKAVRDSVVNQGAPFGLMARRYSEEERSASQGGRVTDPQSGNTTLRLEALGSSWRETLDTLEVGEVSHPTEVRLLGSDEQRAFHIVKLTDRAPRHQLSLDEDYARIKNFALREKKQRVYQQWVKTLRDEVYVDVRAGSGSPPMSAR